MPSHRSRPPILTAIAAIGVALAACAGPGTSASSSPSATVTSSADPSLAETPAPTGPSPLLGGALDPGTYTTTTFVPTLIFTVGEGWRANFEDDEDEVALDGPDKTFLGITRVTHVVDPQTGDVVPVPDDLIAWLRAIPGVTTTKPKAIEVAGMTGTMIRLTTDDSTPSIDTFAYPTGNMRIPSGSNDRYIVIPMEGPDLTFIIGSELGGDAAIEHVQPVLDSLQISSN